MGSNERNRSSKTEDAGSVDSVSPPKKMRSESGGKYISM
uniref:Uncharacterized protein n=1 Tax=Glossina morsitans morsitans TaxID=37546 RepID=A0A1B0FRH5_GLOMM